MQQELKLADVFGAGMVLQCGVAFPVGGRAPAGQEVQVALAGHTAVTRADAEGRFVARLPAMPPGGPHELVVRCGDARLVLADVLLGEVWLCSGQSNMEWPVRSANNPEQELADAELPRIRLLNLRKNAEPRPSDVVADEWVPAQAVSVADFSAVGFFFGRQLHRELGVPVGLVGASWGGTTAEAWTPREALRAEPALAHLAPSADTPDEQRQPPKPHEDTGNEGHPRGWAENEPNPETDPALWQPMNLPRRWQQDGLNHNGAVWFRRTLDLPADACPGEVFQGEATLSLGILDDFDDAYVNGTRVGGMDATCNAPWSAQRVYDVPAGLLRPGRNTVAVRVFDQWGDGGFCGPLMRLFLQTADGQKHDLSGTWHYRVERALPQRSPGGVAVRPAEPYNGMIHPLLPLPVRGVLWYQGESNAGRAWQYRTLLPAMIRAWRHAFGADVPFYVVQLANYGPRTAQPADSNWAELRDAQAHTARTVSAVHLVTAVDLGEAADIHPRDKQSVARRLCDAALATTYDKPRAWRSPQLLEATFAADAATLRFTDAAGLHLRSDPANDPGPGPFQLCGADGEWAWAECELLPEGGGDAPQVRVHSPAVPHPAAVRYAWADDPKLTLFNGQGLPVLPFRTDDFPLITRHNA